MSQDLDHIMQVMEAAFEPQWGEAWTRRQVADSLAFAHTHYRLVDFTGAPVEAERAAAGFTLVRAAPGEEELLLIAATPAARGKGLGHQLLRRAADDGRCRGAERLFLEMRDNNPARSLYLRFGFRAIGTRQGYYHAVDGSKLDAITFAYDL